MKKLIVITLLVLSGCVIAPRAPIPQKGYYMDPIGGRWKCYEDGKEVYCWWRDEAFYLSESE